MNGNVVQNVTKAATQGGRQLAVDLAKKAAQEQLKVFETAKAQMGLPASEKPTGGQSVEMQMPSDENFEQQQPAGPSYEQIKVESDARGRQLLAQLEGELQRIRMESEQKKMIQQRQAEQVVAVQQKQEIIKKESRFQKAVKAVKSRIAGKREQQKGGG